MRTNIFSLLFAVASLFSVYADSNDQAKEVELRKEKPSDYPRAPELNPAQFNAILFMGELTVTAENYTGSVTLQVTGSTGAFTETAYFTEAGNAVFDISSLPEGVYLLTLYTSRGIYTGEFSL